MFVVMELLFGGVVVCVRVGAVLAWWCGVGTRALLLVAFVALITNSFEIVHVILNRVGCCLWGAVG